MKDFLLTKRSGLAILPPTLVLAAAGECRTLLMFDERAPENVETSLFLIGLRPDAVVA
jgi:hypothetical protein